MKSIIQSKKECFICRVNYDVTTTNELIKHHIFEETHTRNEFIKHFIKSYL